MYDRILVPIDGSATSRKGLDEAIKLALLCGASLRLVHVLDLLAFTSGFETARTVVQDIEPHARQVGQAILDEGRDRAMASGIRQVETRLEQAGVRRTHEVILEEAAKWHADLIVLGTHGRRGVDRLLLGSDAERVLRTSPVPVLLVRKEADGGSPVQAAQASCTA